MSNKILATLREEVVNAYPWILREETVNRLKPYDKPRLYIREKSVPRWRDTVSSILVPLWCLDVIMEKPDEGTSDN